MAHDNAPAYPVEEKHGDGTFCYMNMGLTKLECYAMAAMEGHIASGGILTYGDDAYFQSNARAYFRMAHAMIAVGQEGGE